MKTLILCFLSFIFIPCISWADDFGAVGAPICGYGQYRLNGECYEYGVQNDTLCDGDSVSGAACLAAFVESSGEFADLSPFSGGFADIGAPSTAFENMKANDCLETMDGYYVTGVDWYSPVVNATCSSGVNYVIANDCQYIDMTSTDPNNVHSPLHPDNWMCGVLCDTGLIYIGTSYASSEICTKKKININWNPDNGADVIQNVCTYDEDILFPSDPVRPGYTFTGWKVVE